MEWVRVKYPEQRDVFIDGDLTGPTNAKLPVGEGTYTFDLGQPVDYEPASIEKLVSGTTETFPREIEFKRKVGP